MAAYLYTLTDNLLVIGAIPALSAGLWGLGALFSPLGRGRRLGLITVLAAIAQAALLAALTWVTFGDDRSTDDLLRVTLVLYGFYGVVAGLASVTRTTVIDRRAGPTERTDLYRSRAFLAALFVPLAGIVAYQVLDEPTLLSQRAFAYLFLAATAAVSTSAFLTILIQSRVSVDGLATMQIPMTRASRSTTSTIRTMAIFRLALAAAALGDVFLIVFAIDELGMPTRYLGSAVVVLGLSLLLFQSPMRMISNRRGGRAALQIAAAAKLVPPLLALSLTYLQRSETYQERVTDERYASWVIVGSFAFVGLAITAVTAGGHRYIEDTVPLRSRVQAGRAVNVALILGSLAALGGGAIADRWGFDIAFAVAAGVGLLAIILSGTLSDVRGDATIPAATRLSRSAGYRSLRLGRG